LRPGALERGISEPWQPRHAPAQRPRHERRTGAVRGHL